MTDISCPACGTANSPGQKFCGECGAALPRLCPACGTPAAPGQKFCGECGTVLTATAGTPAASSPAPAPPAGRLADEIAPTPIPDAAPAIRAEREARSGEERRLVTVLFCDLVGFTPMSEALDPEEVRDIQAEYFTAMSAQIERYAGVVEKYAGDAVLALFGAPVAHEDDAERAVLCALGMQAAIEPVATQARERWGVQPAIRVGVNTGDVVSGTWSASGRQDVAVTGDAVNTAARIQAAAEPGEVLVGTETMRLTRRRIRYGDRRDVTLKGKLGAVPLYPALGVRERFGERWETSDRATPLVGRDRELLTLLDAWVRAQAGEGQLVTVIGDAGVGKSRLVSEAVERLSATSGVRVVRARCLSYGQHISLWLVADLLRSLFGITENELPDEIGMKLRYAVPSLLPGSDAATQAEALDVIGEVLGLPAGGSRVAQAGAQIRRQTLIRGLRGLLDGISATAPAVLLLEDVHWIDASSSEILTEILADVPGFRTLALVAQRPGWIAPWNEWGWSERITLRPLRDTDAAILAGAVLGGMRLSPELERYVAERAGGNPFFVEELLRALEESGGLERRDGEMHLAPGAAERLPSTLTEILLARLDRLEGQVRSVVQVASVIGRSFAVRLLAQVMERETAALELPLSALQQAEIAFPRRGSDLEYVFKHVTMREVAYNTLVQKRRQHLHLQTARAIASLYATDEYVEVIAYHYSRTAEHAEAAEWLEKAGDRAAAIYATETAVANFEEARRRREAIGADPSVLARLDSKLGSALTTAGRYDEAVPLLESAIEQYREIRDLEGAGNVAAVLGKTQGQRGDFGEGLEVVDRMIDLLSWSGHSGTLAWLYVTRARLLQGFGRYSEMLEAAEHSAEIARSLGDEGLLGAAEERRGTTFSFLGQADEAREALERAIPLLERVGDLDRLRVANANLGEACRLRGELQDALFYNQRALEVDERVGDPSYTAFGLMNIAEILTTLGRWDEAREHLQRAEDAIAGAGSASATAAFIPTMLAQLLLYTGDWDEAEAALDGSMAALTIVDRQVMDMATAIRATLAMRRGDNARALDLLQLRAVQEGALRVMLETTLSRAYLESGAIEEALDLATTTVERARRQHEIMALPDALRVQGAALQRIGRDAEAAASFAEGLTIARALPYPYGEAHILTELGRLDEALTIFRRLGAQRDVASLEAALAARN